MYVLLLFTNLLALMFVLFLSQDQLWKNLLPPPPPPHYYMTMQACVYIYVYLLQWQICGLICTLQQYFEHRSASFKTDWFLYHCSHMYCRREQPQSTKPEQQTLGKWLRQLRSQLHSHLLGNLTGCGSHQSGLPSLVTRLGVDWLEQSSV